jgi:hypothetical protein
MADSLRAMKDRGGHALRRAAVGFLTGPAGRLTAFLIDVGVASGRYFGRRVTGKETPW